MSILFGVLFIWFLTIGANVNMVTGLLWQQNIPIGQVSVCTIATVNISGAVNQRKGPGTEHGIIHTIPGNETVVVLEGPKSNGWYLVDHEGVIGWVWEEYLIVSDRKSSTCLSNVTAISPANSTLSVRETPVGSSDIMVTTPITNSRVEQLPASSPLFSILSSLFQVNLFTVCGGVLILWAGYRFVTKITKTQGVATKTVDFVARISTTIMVVVVLTSLGLDRPSPKVFGWGVSWVVTHYVVVSLITFLVYGYDKGAAALNQNERIPEATLHFLELLGGWPGALIAQPTFRHKINWRNKFDFKFLTWFIAAVHVISWAVWFYYK